MTPTTLFILAATCSLAVPVALFLVLWRRDTRRLAADNQASEARERDATSRLGAEARLAAAEQALSAEKELRQRYEGQVQALTEQRTRTEAELAALRASSEAEIASLRAKNAEDRAAEKAEREKLEETFRAQFRNLATEILGEQSKHFKETNKESLDVLLKPFRDNIVEFRKRVEDIYTTQTAQRGELKAELKNLMELNRRITTETTNLTNALKGNSKVQGDWGEMLLETILDSSALIKGIHYETQYNIKDAEGHNLRPDVVLHLPEKKDIVIDSKVSLTAFVGYTSAETEEERRRCLAAHTASVRQHVNELGRKEYQRLLNSPDFVIMFIPNEPAFLAALQNDAAIWSDAYDKKVIISSPTNLFALLKLVADLWKYNDQDKNTRDIAACGLKLYEQLVAFTGSLEGVGTALDKARDAYDDAYKRLCTGNDNIIRVGERLRRTARLQTKKQHSARTLESAGEDDLHAEHVVPRDPVLDRAQAPGAGHHVTTHGRGLTTGGIGRVKQPFLFAGLLKGQRIDARLDDRHKIFTGNIKNAIHTEHGHNHPRPGGHAPTGKAGSPPAWMDRDAFDLGPAHQFPHLFDRTGAHHRQHGASPEAGVRRVYPQRVFLERRVILEKRFEKRTLFRREGRFCCIHCLLLVGVRRKNR